MLHMIDDQIEAYRRAVADTARARAVFKLNPHSENNDYLVSCLEEEQLRLDGLKSVIGMALREYAAREPCNPFAINDDVNQPPVQPRSRLQHFMDDDPQVRNEHGTFPPPPRKT